MTLRKAYRGARFVATEPFGHLSPWSRPVAWEPKGYDKLAYLSHRYMGRLWYHTNDGQEGITAYLDWLIHRNPHRAYWRRRIGLPCGLMITLLEALLAKQQADLETFVSIPKASVERYRLRQRDSLKTLETLKTANSVMLPAMRVMRVHSTLIKNRLQLFRDVSAEEDGLLQAEDSIKIPVTPWILFGPVRFFPARALRKLLVQQMELEFRIQRFCGEDDHR